MRRSPSEAPLAEPFTSPRRRIIRFAGLYVVLALVSIPFVYPFIWLAAASLKTSLEIFSPAVFPAVPQWSNLVEVFLFQPFARNLLNSVIISLATTSLVLVFSLYAGYALARIRFRGAGFVFILFTSALIMPAEVTIVPNYFILRALGLIDSHLGVVLLPTFGAAGVFALFLMRQYFLGFPSEIEEAARLDGLTRFGLIWRIALPIAKPVVAALAVITFYNSWNLFLEPLILIDSPLKFTVTVALASFVNPYGEPVWHLQLAATLISILPVVAVYLFAERYVTDVLGTGVKG